MKKFAIILCAGSASRSGLSFNKIFYPIGQKNVLETVLDKFDDFDKIIIVATQNDINKINEIVRGKKDITIVVGGSCRSESVYNGLKAAHGCQIVAIHDAARPFVSKKLIEKTIESARKFGSGIPAIKVVDSIKQIHANADEQIIIEKTLDRNCLYAAQTPQIFLYDRIIESYKKIKTPIEDDSEVYRLAGFKPVVVEGESTNKKLTTPSDFLPTNSQLIGTGFDVHQLIDGRDLVVGGIKIPYTKGLAGHSDADVLIHAIMDSLLSAAGICDIGTLFPDNDNSYKNISSMILLKDVFFKLQSMSINIEFISAVIIAQNPKMAPHIYNMRKAISENLNIGIGCINISATTTEFMGIIGNGDAIASSAVCLCSRK